MKAKVKAAKLPKSRKPAAEKKSEKRHRAAAVQNLAESVALNNGELEVKYVLHKQVRPDAEQPRKTFDQEKLLGLAASFKAVGMRQPIQVERLPGGGYQIVDGERRWRAAGIKGKHKIGDEEVDLGSGLERVPVMVVDTSSPEWEKQKLAIQMVLNQQHENITALEEAAAYGREIESGRHTAESLYKALGISRGTLFSRLALNRLKGAVRDALLAGRINTSVAGLVATVPGEETQKELLEQITQGEYGHGAMSFRQAQELLEKRYLRQLKGAPFDTEKLYVMPGQTCVACGNCPKRSGNMAEMFPELGKRPNVCTDVECFDRKWEAEVALKVAAAKKEGKKVIEGPSAKQLFHDYGECELNYNSPYVDLSERCGPLGYDYKNHWKAALKDEVKNVEVVLAVAPNGELRELVKAEEAEKALKAAGHKFEKNTSGYRQPKAEKQLAEERKEREAEKLRKAECDAITAAIVEKVEGMKEFGAEWLWTLAARALMDRSGFYIMQPIEKRRGWKRKNYQSSHDDEFAKMTLGQRVALALEIATQGEDSQNEALKSLGLDAKAIAKQVREEMGRKPGGAVNAKSSPAGAKKKGAK